MKKLQIQYYPFDKKPRDDKAEQFIKYIKQISTCFRDIDSDGKEDYKECLCEPEDLQYKHLWERIYKEYNQLLSKYDATKMN